MDRIFEVSLPCVEEPEGDNEIRFAIDDDDTTRGSFLL